MTTSRLGLGLSAADSVNPHDLHFDADGNLVIVRDETAVGQHVRQRLMTFEGEWFLDTICGLPWLTDIFGKRENLPLAEAIVKNEILDTDGVSSLSGLSAKFDPRKRNLEIQNFSVVTEYGKEVES